MDGIHDLGGRQGFGKVEPEVDEPVFHERWEAGIYTIVHRMIAEGLIRNVDQFRHAIERIDPVAYLTHGYYGRWLGGIENLLTESGFISREELDRSVTRLGGDLSELIAARPGRSPDSIPAAEAPGAERPVAASPLFSVGQSVRTRTSAGSGHTRLPGYARGRIGTIVSQQGGWVFPDTNAHGLGEHPQHLYCVRFSGETLWGDEAEAGQSVHLDLFESYLEARDD